MDQAFSLNYFNRVGKIELCRLIFAAAGVDFTDNCNVEKSSDSDIQEGFEPYLKVDHTHIPCVSVISRYLAREFNLAGKTNLEQAKCDAISQNVTLLIDRYYRDIDEVEDIDSKRVALKNYMENDLPNTAGICEKLIEKYCEKNPKNEGRVICQGYCVGNELTYADLFVYEMVSKYFPNDSDDLPQRYPNLYAVQTRVQSLASIETFNRTNKNLTPTFSKNSINDLNEQ